MAADPSMNPFTTMNPTPVAEAPVGNPFDVFGSPNNVDAASQPTATAAEAPLTTTPSLPSQSNPFAVMGTTLPMENLQIGEKPANEPYLQQPWQAPMNGHHASAVPSLPQVTTQMQQQQPQLQREQAASPQPPPPQQYTTMPVAPAPFAQAAPTPATDQNPFSWSQPPAPAPTPSVENPWNGGASMPSVQPVPTPFDSFAAAPQAPAPYPQPSSAVAGNPFMAPPATGYSNAMVPSQQTSNAYSGLVVPQQQQQQQYPPTSQAMVPVAPSSSSQWSVNGQQAPARAASFDPFAPAPLPAAAPAPPPAPVLPPAPAPVAQDPFFGNAMVPAASIGAYPGAPPSNALVPAPNAAYPGAMVPVDAPPPSQSYAKPPPTETQLVTHRSEHSKSDASINERGSHNNNDNRQMVAYKPDNNHDEDNVPNDRQLAVVPDDDIEKPKRNLFSEALSKNAPPGSAPLPKADLVVKAGFVLSRISFRTIVMKKWKQSYWVQYGPHTMLWFRSQADFDDWLNNPYHTPSQRNFLIKLAVNFVHDLYKPNVRGYQVTQARTKSYGREQIKQFKLERWMDYGPTIAAAFGSQDPKEVDNLRQALVECMRNTPLEGGVRATGAVRQDHDGRRRDSGDEDDPDRSYSYDSERMAGASYDEEEHHDRSKERDDHSSEHDRKNPPNTEDYPPPPAAAAAAPVGDLLDNSFFEVPLATDQAQQPPAPMQQQGQPGPGAPPSYPGAPQPNYGQPQGYGQPYPPPPSQGYAQQPPAQYQQQAPVYSQPSPQLHYYGFPPVPTQYPGQQPPPPQQQQQY